MLLVSRVQLLTWPLEQGEELEEQRICPSWLEGELLVDLMEELVEDVVELELEDLIEDSSSSHDFFFRGSFLHRLAKACRLGWWLSDSCC